MWSQTKSGMKNKIISRSVYDEIEDLKAPYIRYCIV